MTRSPDKLTCSARGAVIGQAQTDDVALAGCERELEMGRRFGAGLVGIDGRAMAVDHGLVDAVFDERSGVGAAKEAYVVGLILGEEQGPRAQET